jgi:hypothetical protein
VKPLVDTDNAGILEFHMKINYWLIFLMVIFSFPLTATEKVKYCFKNKETGAMVFGCQIKKPSRSTPQQITCFDHNENEDYPFAPNKIEVWEKIKEGDPDCRKRKETPGVPRG